MMRLSLHHKFSLGVCFLVAVLMASVITIADRSITSGIEGKIRKDLLAARLVFDQLQESRVQQLMTSTKMLAETPYIKAVVTTQDLDHATVLDSARNAQELVKSGLLLLSDERGRLLASTAEPDRDGNAEPDRDGNDLSREPAFAAALRGEEYSGIQTTEKGLHQVVALPFLQGDAVVGALLTGFVIDQQFVEWLESRTNCHVALIHRSTLLTSPRSNSLFQGLDVVKTTVLPKPSSETSSGTANATDESSLAGVSEPTTKAFGDERYVLMKAPFGGSDVSYVLARSLDNELLFYRQLRERLFLVAGAILLVAIVLVAVYAQRMTRPIHALAAEAGRIATGDLETRVVSDSKDEIGDLARAFNRMIGDLKQSRDELVQAQKMEAIGRLAGGVAHDFNNLLTAILGYSELLQRKSGDPVLQKRYIEQIDATAMRAAALTQQLLAFSRRQLLQPRVIDVNNVVGDMQSMLRRLIGEDVELVVHRAETPVRIKADPNQIEQVIMNLAVNARDAMPRGGRLTIETSHVELQAGGSSQPRVLKSGPHVLLSVTDTGVGMDPETQSHIFEPFFTTKGERGTGLGLSTVYGIVEQSGGRIRVESHPGRGTRFEVTLPCVEEEPVQPPPPPQRARPTGGDETILIVEDEAVVRTLAGESLRESGYRVLEARHGIEALSICEKHSGAIHLVITDIVMPLMGGGELGERLARLRPDLRVLYMTGYTDDALGHQGVPSSGAAFLRKPFTPHTLATKVREVLEGQAVDAD